MIHLLSSRLGVLAVAIPGVIVSQYESFFRTRLSTDSFETGRFFAWGLSGMLLLLLGLLLNRWKYKKVIGEDGCEMKHSFAGFPIEYLGGLCLAYSAGGLILNYCLK
jgi:hypothetical protein